ncbi:MAG: hypothetical protein KF833_13415 [Verrucomicrobiae bacterium]|nr:hypothetical protein [Verrucomicrobiae bacterium]
MNRCLVRLALALALLGAPGVAPALEGILRTTDGTTLRGEVDWTPDGWRVRAEDGEPVPVALSELVELAMDEPEPEPVATGDGEGSGNDPAPEGPAAEPWETAQIGGGLEGGVTEVRPGWQVTGGGLGLRGNADNVFLAYRPLEVSGQIVGRLSAFDGTDPEAMAGVTLRDNLGEASAYAFIGMRVGSGLCFQYRQIAGGMTMRVTNVAMPLPAWLRLSRVGGAVVAELSADGRQWRTVGRANINLGRNVRAGLTVTAGLDNDTAEARFDAVSMGARGLAYLPATGYPRLLLRGGSVLAAPVVSGDESVLRLGGDWAGSLVSVLNLARIEFVPLAPETEARIDDDRSGVLLADGDFLDGTLRGIATNTVTMSSILFGYRQFAIGSEVAAVLLGTVEPDEATFHVRTRDGSELRARRLELGPEFVRVESPLLGSFQVRTEEIRQLRRGARER